MVLGSLRPDADEINQLRKNAGKDGPHIKNGIPLIADALNTEGRGHRYNRIGENATRVHEQAKGDRNLVVSPVHTYQKMVERMREIGKGLGHSETEVDIAMGQAFQKFSKEGKIPENLTGEKKDNQLPSDVNFFPQIARIMLTSETQRSPTNLADVAQVVRAVANGHLPLSAFSTEFPAGLAKRKSNWGQGILPRDGGSPGTRRALEIANDIQMGDNALGRAAQNATDRAAQEVFDRQARLAENDPLIGGAKSEEELVDVFYNDIINTLFGGTL